MIRRAGGFSSRMGWAADRRVASYARPHRRGRLCPRELDSSTYGGASGLGGPRRATLARTGEGACAHVSLCLREPVPVIVPAITRRSGRDGGNEVLLPPIRVRSPSSR